MTAEAPNATAMEVLERARQSGPGGASPHDGSPLAILNRRRIVHGHRAEERSLARGRRGRPPWPPWPRDAGQRLAQFRLALGVPQSVLAQALGIAQFMVSVFESAARRPSPEVRERLADVATSLLISWDWIEHGKGSVFHEVALVNPGVDPKTPPQDLSVGPTDRRALERVPQLRARVAGATILTGREYNPNA